jgi:hypothetical protein
MRWERRFPCKTPLLVQSGYSECPAASRASSLVQKTRRLVIRPSVSQKTSQDSRSTGKPLPLPRPPAAGRHEDPVIAQGRCLLDLEVAFLKDFEEQLPPLSRLRPPAVDVSKPREGQGLPDDLWAQETQPGIRVAPIDGINRFPHDLDVLLRNHLLRQPGGFEGLLARLIEAVAHDLRPPHVVDAKEVALDLNPAPPARAALVKDDHHRIPRIEVLAG